MVAWIFLQDFYTGEQDPTGLAYYADKAKSAEVDPIYWDDRWYVRAFTLIFGILGI